MFPTIQFIIYLPVSCLQASYAALREGHMLKVFENKVLARTFGPEIKITEEDCIMKSYVID